MTKRIDVHHHMLPGSHIEALKDRGHDVGALPGWTPETSLALMDELGIEKAILSIPSPGTSDPSLARSLNEYAAQLVIAHPARLGALATIPFPDVDASVGEVAHALGELGLDGAILFSNARGAYLGDPEYDAILAELDRRGAMVLVHANDRPGIEDHQGADPFVEYPTDVARAYARLVHSHAFTRFRKIRWVFASAGGVVPFLAERIGKLHYVNGKKLRWGLIAFDLLFGRNSGLELAREVFYDTADIGTRFALNGLRRLVEPEKILFGSNAPFADKMTIATALDALAA